MVMHSLAWLKPRSSWTQALGSLANLAYEAAGPMAQKIGRTWRTSLRRAAHSARSSSDMLPSLTLSSAWRAAVSCFFLAFSACFFRDLTACSLHGHTQVGHLCSVG